MSADIFTGSIGQQNAPTLDIQDQVRTDAAALADMAKHDLDAISQRAKDDVHLLGDTAGKKIAEAPGRALHARAIVHHGRDAAGARPDFPRADVAGRSRGCGRPVLSPGTAVPGAQWGADLGPAGRRVWDCARAADRRRAGTASSGLCNAL